jgi:hypothetical protein
MAKNKLPMMLVKSAVKDLLRDEEMLCGGDLIDELNTVVAHNLRLAVKRCKSNGRSTVRAGDM